MLTNVLHNRDNKLSLLIKLGDCLGRSLRENVELFSVDDNNTTYLTESNKLIKGKYSITKDVVLENIKIATADIFEDAKKYDNFIGNKVGDFVKNLYENSYPQAELSFSNLLSLWEDRLKFDKMKAKIREAKEKFGPSTNIINTPEFTRLLEATKNIAEYLKENADKIENIEEIKNAVKLSNTVSKAFDFQRLDYNTLEENKNYKLKDGNSKSIYEIIYYKLQKISDKDKLTKQNIEMVRELSYKVEKYNLYDIHKELIYLFLSDSKYTMNQKSKLIQLFANSEYNYQKSYRSLIHIENLFIQLLHLSA